MELQELSTPAFLVDLDRFTKNADAMKRKARQLGVRLRPHVKTHKTIEGARLQMDPKFNGIAVSTLAEARFFAQAEVDDIVYAVNITPQKLDTAFDIEKMGVRLSLVLDHPQSLDAVERFCAEKGTRFRIFLKVDCGYHRCGVDPQHSQGITLAKKMDASPHVNFMGILTHAGHAYRVHDAHSRTSVATMERDIMRDFGHVLRQNGVSCPTISIGSTPSLMAAKDLQGIDEIRPGNYVFFDVNQVHLGSCRLDDCAAFVWSSVIGQYPEQNRLVIDAGAIALSKDAGKYPDGLGQVYGILADHPYLVVSESSQEHGCITGCEPIDFRAFPIGTKVRVIPYHSCLAAASFSTYHVVSQEKIVDFWHPTCGW